MPLKAPRAGHPVRELIDVDEVVGMTFTAYKLLPTVTEARKAAKVYFRSHNEDYRHELVRHEDGQVLLMTFGRKAGYRTRWNFGRHNEVPHHEFRGEKGGLTIIDDFGDPST